MRRQGQGSRQAGARQRHKVALRDKQQHDFFGKETKIPFEFLVPRNNKLSQVTVYLFLGPKTAAVFLFKLITKPNVQLHSKAHLTYSFLTTQEYIGGWIKSGMSLQNPALATHLGMCGFATKI